MVKLLEARRTSGAVELSVFGRPFSLRYAEPAIERVAVSELSAYAGQSTPSGFQNSIYDGGKFAGGFGQTQIFDVDYWTLRQRSAQLFTENLYARGLIRRLVTNEINTGLTPEASPDEDIIGVPEDSLSEWTEIVENRFAVWGRSPKVCDWRGQSTFGAIQRAARTEALVNGDVLVVVRQSPITNAPAVQLVSGDRVRTPFVGDVSIPDSHVIRHGVELNAKKRVVAYWVKQDTGGFERIAAKGPRSGRRIAWLVFGTDKRHDDLRGQPLLSLMLQSLKEIDRYRDAVQRKAVVNSILAMFIKKTEDKMGTLPATGGAVRRDSVAVTDGDGSNRTFNIAQQIPGVVMEELQQGEEPVGFHNQGTDTNLSTFEAAIINTIAWANEIPPEVLTLAFTKNYSASQAAINEFKIYLNMVWSNWGETFCTPIYIEFLLSEILVRRINAPGLLAAWRDPRKWDVFGAWVSVEWFGSVKPANDMLKQAKGSQLLIKQGWSTNARESRGNNGSKFTKNVKRLKRENVLLVEALRPLADFRAEFGESDPDAVALMEEYVSAGVSADE